MVQFKTAIGIFSILIGLYGCANKPQMGSVGNNQYQSAEELIRAEKLNQASGQAKEYVYDWGSEKKRNVESLQPRQHLASFCQSRGGRFILAYKSQFGLVKETRAKTVLAKSSQVTQGIGAYRCVATQSWLVSIEPTAERKLDEKKRVVALLSKVMTEAEAQRFYRNNSAKKTEVPVKAPVNTKEKSPITEPAPETNTATTRVVETPQQQQAKLYVSARRDINSGKNQVNACNAAQRAYNYGKLQGTEGTRIYTESGMLVARCLTQISAYSSRFPNANAQAKRILQNLANNYNHSAAKTMLRQMK